jgi:ribonuclease BN (tRNA processing enzyme)
MKIRFLGTSHGFNEPGRFCSSAVVSTGGRHYVIDAGAPIMGLLATYGYAYTDLGGIFITHTHQDHYGGLPEFVNQIEGFGCFAAVRVNVYVPQEFPVGKLFMYLFDDPSGKAGRIPGGTESKDQTGPRVSFVCYPDKESMIFDDGSVKVTAVPTQHCAHSHAFVIEAEGRRVVFSGDLRSGFPDYPAVLTDPGAGRTDLLIIEGAHTRLDSEESIALFRRTGTGRLIVNHCYHRLNPGSVIERLRGELADLYPVDEAFDGMEVEV